MNHTDHDSSFVHLILIIAVCAAIWHALRRAWAWIIHSLHHWLPLIPWHTIAWVGGSGIAVALGIMVARHRVHQRRSRK